MWNGPTLLALTAAIAVAGVSCAEAPALDLEAEREALRAADRRYTELAQARDAAAIVELYAADAIMYPPDGATVSGLDGVRRFAAEFTAVPGLRLSFRPAVLEVSSSGDVGWVVNLGEITYDGPDGTPVTDHVRDIHIWRKQSDGSWKVVLDFWNTEPP